MSIFKEPPLPPTPAAQRAQQIRDWNTQGLDTLRSSLRSAFDAVWKSSDATPQEVLNEFGTSAGSLFAASQKTLEFAAAIAQINGLPANTYLDPAEFTPPLSFTINQNGSVTIG